MPPTRLLLWALVLSFVLSAFSVASRGLPASAALPRREASSMSGKVKRGGGPAPDVFMGAPAMAESAPSMGMAAPMMAMAGDAGVQYDEGGGGAAMPMRAKAFATGNGGGVPGVVGDMLLKGGGELPPAKDMLQGPVILRDGSMSAEVVDIPAAMTRLESDLKTLGGYVSSSNTWVDGYLTQLWDDYKRRLKDGHSVPNKDDGAVVAVPAEGAPTGASVQLRVPAAAFDDALAAVKSLAAAAGGRVTSHSTNAHDASEEYVDVVTRQRIEERALEQMETLLKAAQTVEHVLAIKREMDGISYRLEAAKARRKNLEGRASMSSLSVSFTIPRPPSLSPPPPPDPRGWSIGATFRAAFGALGSVLQGVLEVLIFTIVFAGPVLLVLLLGYKVWHSTPAQRWGTAAARRLLATAGGASASSSGGATANAVGPMGTI